METSAPTPLQRMVTLAVRLSPIWLCAVVGFGAAVAMAAAARQ